jgi:hypothetical protein
MAVGAFANLTQPQLPISVLQLLKQVTKFQKIQPCYSQAPTCYFITNPHADQTVKVRQKFKSNKSLPVTRKIDQVPLLVDKKMIYELSFTCSVQIFAF